MCTKKVFLLINGEPPKTLPDLKAYDLICATDGAYQYLLENRITPDFISGDFDSLTQIPHDIEVLHTPDQDFTDFEKCLQILHNKGFKEVDVYGGSGQEQDHFLGNLSTAVKWKSKLKLTFYDNFGYYFLANTNTTINHCAQKTISLVPFPEAHNIVTRGLKYPLNNESLAIGSRMGTRNTAVENLVTITFKKGNLFVFVNN